MAFCTICGASLTGAFCTKCGTPAASAAAAAPNPGAAAGAAPTNGAAAAPAATSAAAPVRRKTSPLVWVLIVVLGFFAIIVIGMIGTGVFLARRGAGYAIAKIIASANPNAEVVSTDDGAGTITIRDRHTGKTVTMSFDDAKHGRFRLEAEDDNGKRAAIELGGSASLPSWVPAYPGSNPHAVFSAKGESDEGAGEGGNFTFTTPDPPSRVRSFYEDEGRRLGMDIHVKTNSGEADVLVMKDSDDRRSLTVMIGGSSGGGDTAVNVTYGRKR
jgi:hypothetical protein